MNKFFAKLVRNAVGFGVAVAAGVTVALPAAALCGATVAAVVFVVVSVSVLPQM